jgi:hypothetical protein
MLSNTKELYAFGNVVIKKNSRGYHTALFKKNINGSFYICDSKSQNLSISEALEDLRSRANRDYSSILLLINELSEEK